MNTPLTRQQLRDIIDASRYDGWDYDVEITGSALEIRIEENPDPLIITFDAHNHLCLQAPCEHAAKAGATSADFHTRPHDNGRDGIVSITFYL